MASAKGGAWKVDRGRRVSPSQISEAAVADFQPAVWEKRTSPSPGRCPVPICFAAWPAYTMYPVLVWPDGADLACHIRQALQ
jgi:hypothetical protein